MVSRAALVGIALAVSWQASSQARAATLLFMNDNRALVVQGSLDQPFAGQMHYQNSLSVPGGTASQDSELSPTGITGTGSSFGSGMSRLDVRFYTLEPSQFTLTGSIEGGIVQAFLSDDYGTSVDLSGPFSFSSPLVPYDTWRIFLAVAGGSTSPASWQLQLTLPEPAGPVVLTLLGAACCLRRRLAPPAPRACR